MSEKILLQAAMIVTLAVPFGAAAISLVQGPTWLDPQATATDLDSHFRYLSGLFGMMALLMLSCVPDVEHKGPRMRLLGALIVAGGLARLASLVVVGRPSDAHLGALGIELAIVPLLMLWQARVARRFASES